MILYYDRMRVWFSYVFIAFHVIYVVIAVFYSWIDHWSVGA